MKIFFSILFITFTNITYAKTLFTISFSNQYEKAIMTKDVLQKYFHVSDRQIHLERNEVPCMDGSNILYLICIFDDGKIKVKDKSQSNFKAIKDLFRTIEI